jgi:hypothetical protein
MSWREFVTSRIGPGALCGLTFGDWFRLLSANRFAVHPAYWPRAGAITWGSVPNSLFARWEAWRYDAAIRQVEPEPPLFVLGIWRSGTTHLHNLLARDPRFAYPNFFEVFYPHTFLTTEWLNGPMLAAVMPEKRPQDNVRMAVSEPQEDEFALNCLTQLSWVLCWTLPRRAAHYERYLSFREAPRAEIERWQAALRWFVQKLTYKHRRPLVLKSPAHTARVRLLLEIFPEARFVHIHRNPYDVVRSSMHSARKAVPWWSLQRPDFSDLEETTIRQYEEVYRAYFDERSLIPAGRLHEIEYETLERDPLGTLDAMYAALDLPPFGEAAPAIRDYLASIAGYEKNRHTPLAEPLRERVATRLRPYFDAWGYAV